MLPALFVPSLRLILLYFLAPSLLQRASRSYYPHRKGMYGMLSSEIPYTHRFGWRNRDGIAQQQRGWHLTNASANARSNVIRKGWGGARRELYLKHVLTVNEASLTNKGGVPAPSQPANPNSAVGGVSAVSSKQHLACITMRSQCSSAATSFIARLAIR